MTVRIAIPIPTADDAEYNARTLPPYEEALRSAGAEVVQIPLTIQSDELAALLATVQGVLLPGSRFDVDPARYYEPAIPACGPADAVRTSVDEQLLTYAFCHQKPVLAICHGAQSLNVWRGGALIQDLLTCVNHRPGGMIVEAHPIEVEPGTRLRALLDSTSNGQVQVNSTHHQAVRVPGRGLKIAAISPEDAVVEALELDSAEHFVVAVQWHPERMQTESALSRALFVEFVRQANIWVEVAG